MILYCLIWDSDDGTHLEHYFTDQARNDRIKSELTDDWNSARPGEPFPQDWFDAWEVISQFVDYWFVCENIDLRGAVSQNLAWKICKETPGAFGNLYDPKEIATIMDGWSDSDEYHDSSHHFDSDDYEDVQALTAWCEQEGSSFEDDISRLVCDNLPTRREAFAALERKHAAERAVIESD